MDENFWIILIVAGLIIVRHVRSGSAWVDKKPYAKKSEHSRDSKGDSKKHQRRR